MAKRPKKLSFEDFDFQCRKFHELYRWHYGLLDIHTMPLLQNDTRRNPDTFYMYWSLRPGACDMMLLYNRDDDKYPFVVYVDWKRGAWPTDLLLECGQFVMIGEYPDVETAMRNMLMEPSVNISSRIHVCRISCSLFLDKGETYDNTPGFTSSKYGWRGLSFLEALDAVEHERTLDDNAYKGRDIYIRHDDVSEIADDNISFTGYQGDLLYSTTL